MNQPGRKLGYSKYASSAVEWLGRLPAHWKVQPLRWALRALCDGPFGAELKSEHYTPSGVRVVRLQNLGEGEFRDLHRVFVSEEYFAQHQKHDARPGDVLVAALGDEGHPVGRACLLPASISVAMVKADCFRLRLNDRVLSPNFVMYALNSEGVRAGFDVQVHGATRSRIGLDDVRALPMVVPPRDEQDSIVAFLDDTTARIDALLAESERGIALLRQRREAVITLAVLGRLAPTPSLRPSGVGWVGDIPSHWEVKKIRYVARMESGHTPSRSNKEYWQNCTIPWVSLADVKQFRGGQIDEIHETEERISELGLANSSARLLPKGTVILSRTASVGFSVMLGCAMATTQDFVNWVCGPRLLPRYLLACLRAMGDEFRHLRQGSVHNTIYMPDAAGLVIPLPPIEEQRSIAAHIAAETARIDAAIAAAERVAALLRQRRVSLIHAAVSGAIDTRIAGAGAWPSSDAA